MEEQHTFDRNKALLALKTLRNIFTISTGAFAFIEVLQSISEQKAEAGKMRTLHLIALQIIEDAELLPDDQMRERLAMVDALLVLMEREVDANNLHNVITP